jgi:hypothetical protein
VTQPTGTAGEPVVEPVVVPGQPSVKARRGASATNLFLGIAVLAAVGGLAFAAGRLTAPTTTAFPNGGPGSLPFGGNFQGGPGASGAPNGGNLPGGGLIGAGGVTIEGTVQSRTEDTLTIRTPTGQIVEVSLPADTEYHSQAAATGDDVQTGSAVQVRVDVQQGQGQGQPQLSATDVTVVP